MHICFLISHFLFRFIVVALFIYCAVTFVVAFKVVAFLKIITISSSSKIAFHGCAINAVIPILIFIFFGAGSFELFHSFTTLDYNLSASIIVNPENIYPTSSIQTNQKTKCHFSKFDFQKITRNLSTRRNCNDLTSYSK